MASLTGAARSPSESEPSPAFVHSTSSSDVGVGVALAQQRARRVRRVGLPVGVDGVGSGHHRLSTAAEVDVASTATAPRSPRWWQTVLFNRSTRLQLHIDHSQGAFQLSQYVISSTGRRGAGLKPSPV